MNTYYPPNTDISFVMLSREEETQLFTEARAGSSEAREFLIQNHLLFAAMHARRLAKGQLSEPEVVSAANFALMTAFEKFDHTHGSRFTSYLRPFIQGEISKLWKQHFSAETSVPSTEKLEVTDPHGERSCEEHFEWLAEALGETCADVLNAHEREVLQFVYTQGRSFADVARHRGVSREAIRATHARAIEKLRVAFARRGIKSVV